MTGTKERPILFSGPMVRAILDGRKTQTRRVVKHHLPVGPCDVRDIGNGPEIYGAGGVWLPLPCPYDKPGDRLWVRETWAEKAWTDDQCQKMGCPNAPTHPSEIYLETPLRAIHRASCSVAYGDPGPWRPSIHMPRWASRITLEITDVRVERVQDISEDDAIAEGVQDWCVEADPRTGEPIQVRLRPSEEFSKLWDSINATRGLGWDVNPWVWVVEFKRINRWDSGRH